MSDSLRIELGPLSVGALHELLRTRIGAVLPRPTLLRIWERRAGIRSSPSSSRARFSAEAAEWIRARSCRFPRIWKSSFTSASIGSGLPGSRLHASLPRSPIRRAPRRSGRRPPGRGRTSRRDRRPNPRGRRGASPLHPPPAPLGGLVARHTGAASVAPRAARRGRSEHGGTSAASRARHHPAEPRDRRPPRGGGRERARTGSSRCRRRAGRAGSPAHASRGCRGLAPARPRLRRSAPRGRRRPPRDRPARAGATKPPLAGAARAAVLVHLADTVAELVGPREAVDLYREALTEADGNARPQGGDSPQPCRPRDVTEDRNRGLAHAELAVEAASRAGDAALRCKALASVRVPALPCRARHSARADGGGARTRAVAAATGR